MLQNSNIFKVEPKCIDWLGEDHVNRLINIYIFTKRHKGALAKIFCLILKFGYFQTEICRLCAEFGNLEKIRRSEYSPG